MSFSWTALWFKLLKVGSVIYGIIWCVQLATDMLPKRASCLHSVIYTTCIRFWSIVSYINCCWFKLGLNCCSTKIITQLITLIVLYLSCLLFQFQLHTHFSLQFSFWLLAHFCWYCWTSCELPGFSYYLSECIYLLLCCTQLWNDLFTYYFMIYCWVLYMPINLIIQVNGQFVHVVSY